MERHHSNPDSHNSKDKGDLLGKITDHPEDIDSKVNLDYSRKPDGKSLTNDEDPATDPNEVDNKPTFNGNK